MHEDPAEWLREIAKRAREDPRTRFLTLALFLSEIVVRADFGDLHDLFAHSEDVQERVSAVVEAECPPPASGPACAARLRREA